MSTSTHIMLNGSRTRQILSTASGLKLKFRSIAISTSSPVPARNAAICSSARRSIFGDTVWSVGPGPKPAKYVPAPSPGRMMLVFRAVNPLSRTSPAQRGDRLQRPDRLHPKKVMMPRPRRAAVRPVDPLPLPQRAAEKFVDRYAQGLRFHVPHSQLYSGDRLGGDAARALSGHAVHVLIIHFDVPGVAALEYRLELADGRRHAERVAAVGALPVPRQALIRAQRHKRPRTPACVDDERVNSRDLHTLIPCFVESGGAVPRFSFSDNV